MSDLTPMELGALLQCAEAGGTRCNDGGLTDTLLSILCAKPSPENPYARWQINPTSKQDGYISLYTVTDAGWEALTISHAKAQSVAIDREIHYCKHCRRDFFARLPRGTADVFLVCPNTECGWKHYRRIEGGVAVSAEFDKRTGNPVEIRGTTSRTATTYSPEFNSAANSTP